MLKLSILGFAFVEYQMPEHAICAMNDLDGSVFMGRLLHLLPGKENEGPSPTQYGKREVYANTSYKREKLAKMRENAGTDLSSWNSLFVGSNAVADQMAKKGLSYVNRIPNSHNFFTKSHMYNFGK